MLKDDLKGKQKAKLRRLANQKDVMFQIGQAGLTQEVIDNILTNLKKHEVGRVHVLKTCPDDIKKMMICIEKRGIMVVYKIGRTLLLYKENPKLEHRIHL